MIGTRLRCGLTALLALAVLAPAAPAAAVMRPANDDITHATVLAALPGRLTATLAGATLTAGEHPCGGGAGPDVGSIWYRFTPTAEVFAEFRLRLVTSADETELGVYSGPPGALVEQGCTVASPLSDDGAAVVADLRSGTTYYVQIAGYNDNPSTIRFDARARTHPYPVVDRNGTLRVRESFSTGVATTSFSFGSGADTPVFGDWNGDGVSTVGRVHGNRWLLRDTNTGGSPDYDFTYGSANDVKIVGDWDGDGTVTPGVFRNGTFYLRNSNTTGVADETFAFGRAGDIPVVGDWRNQGASDIGVFRDGLWIIPDPELETRSWRFGSKGDRPITGDWDNDGHDSVGVVRGGTWYLQNAPNPSGVADVSFRYGSSCDHALTLTQALTRAACG